MYPVVVPGGTREVDTPRFPRREVSPSENQVFELAQFALRLEETLGQPVDVECAFAHGELYLLLFRPITTIN